MPHKDPEARRAYHAAHYRRNREARLAAQKEYYRARRVEARAYERARRRAEPLQAFFRAQVHFANRAAARWSAPGRIGIRDVRFLPRECVYCGATEDLTVDHATPLSRGGANDWSNLTTACRQCNSLKADQTVAEFRAARAA